MPATTAALSFVPDDPFVVTDVLVDEPRDDEVLVRIEAAGICHTDLVNRVAGTADRRCCWATRAPVWSRRWAPASPRPAPATAWC